jgi:hypothetical protein
MITQPELLTPTEASKIKFICNSGNNCSNLTNASPIKKIKIIDRTLSKERYTEIKREAISYLSNSMSLKYNSARTVHVAYNNRIINTLWQNNKKNIIFPTAS